MFIRAAQTAVIIFMFFILLLGCLIVMQTLEDNTHYILSDIKEVKKEVKFIKEYCLE